MYAKETMRLTWRRITVLDCPLARPLSFAPTCLAYTKPQYPWIDSKQIYEKGKVTERPKKKEWNREEDREKRGSEDGTVISATPKAKQGSLRRRCFLTQHNVTTIVLKLAAVGYSAAAFPCKASPDETQTEKSSRGCRRPFCILIAP